jgi:hypothetical protein
LLALELFSNKHYKLLTKKHFNPTEVTRIRMSRENFSLRQLRALINKGNWKGSIALYINNNLTTLRKFVDIIRR